MTRVSPYDLSRLEITQSDEGEFGVQNRAVRPRVIMDWGKPVQWIGLQPAEAGAIVHVLRTTESKRSYFR